MGGSIDKPVDMCVFIEQDEENLIMAASTGVMVHSACPHGAGEPRGAPTVRKAPKAVPVIMAYLH